MAFLHEFSSKVKRYFQLAWEITYIILGVLKI